MRTALRPGIRARFISRRHPAAPDMFPALQAGDIAIEQRILQPLFIGEGIDDHHGSEHSYYCDIRSPEHATGTQA